MSEATLNPPTLEQINRDLAKSFTEEMARREAAEGEITRLLNLDGIRRNAITELAIRWRVRADEMEAEIERQRAAHPGERTNTERALFARLTMYRSLAKEMCVAAALEW